MKSAERVFDHRLSFTSTRASVVTLRLSVLLF